MLNVGMIQWHVFNIICFSMLWWFTKEKKDPSIVQS